MSRCGWAAAALALAVSVGCEKGGAGAAHPGEEHELVGAKAPGFDLKAQSGGGRAALEDAEGKVVVVDFWATWCEPCKASFPFYQSLVGRHDGDVVVIGVSEDDEPDGIPAFAEETGAEFLLAWDRGGATAKKYKPVAMPTSYLIDRNGFVRYVHPGFRDGDAKVIESKIEKLLE